MFQWYNYNYAKPPVHPLQYQPPSWPCRGDPNVLSKIPAENTDNSDGIFRLHSDFLFEFMMSTLKAASIQNITLHARRPCDSTFNDKVMLYTYICTYVFSFASLFSSECDLNLSE